MVKLSKKETSVLERANRSKCKCVTTHLYGRSLVDDDVALALEKKKLLKIDSERETTDDFITRYKITPKGRTLLKKT